ncbi:cell division ATP-binding protein FtsE [Bifidobacterium aquikefiri]|uniref:cell division ATP-binding protein FtsE n=1 Tax=Bifidobacterium aquikefiri TaxID=1653207 RepID=UPI0039E76AD1
MALISMKHVTKIYPKGTRPALDDVDLEIERGNFVFLVGASGSGKSTLLSLLLHEELATDGEIRVAGNDLRRLSNRRVPQYRRSLGFVFQDYKLLTNKTVWQNVAFALEVIGTRRSTIRSLVPQVLKTVGLIGKENNFPHELSGGEAQRVAIARAYVNHPQILLADEPTGNLDPPTSLGIMEVLDAINRTGTTVVMATHNEEIVNSMRKRVVELHSGKIVRDERNGSYDSAKFFPDADVAAKAHQALKRGAAVNVAQSAESGAISQPLVSAVPSSMESSTANAHDMDRFKNTLVESKAVNDADEGHEASRRSADNGTGSKGSSHTEHGEAAEQGAAEQGKVEQGAVEQNSSGASSPAPSVPPSSASSTLPQPPAKTESEAVEHPKDAHDEFPTEARPGTSLSDEHVTNGTRTNSQAPARDAFNASQYEDTANEGIARLAKSVHSGKTGRYGKAFAPVENTLTWGKGITAEDVKAAANKPPTPPKAASHEPGQVKEHNSKRQSSPSASQPTPPSADGHEEAKQ